MIEGISAVTLATGDMALSVRFYRTFGFEVVYGGEAASFTTFRAEGAFLVSAIWEAGGVKHAEIVSECGGICRFTGFFSGQMVVQDDGGSRIPYTIQDDVYLFETTLGGRYRIGID